MLKNSSRGRTLSAVPDECSGVFGEVGDLGSSHLGGVGKVAVGQEYRSARETVGVVVDGVGDRYTPCCKSPRPRVLCEVRRLGCGHLREYKPLVVGLTNRRTNVIN